MSIMVDHEIRQVIETGQLIIEPFEPSLIQPNSYDVRLANKFSWHEANLDVIDPFDAKSIQSSVKELTADNIVIKPQEFILAATYEKFSLPCDIVGQLTGKSSLARLGLMVHVTAGFIDAGFSHPPAQITLEIVNVGNRPVRLHALMPIGQMVFTKTSQCALPYHQKNNAKYNGQVAAFHSLYYLNNKPVTLT